LVAQFGTVATAAMGVGQRIISIANMFAFGVAQAAAAMVGQYLGADRKNDAYKVVWKAALFNIIVVGIMCTFTFLFGKEITAFFVNEPEVLVEGQNFFNIVSFSIPFFVTFAIFDNALRSSGHTVVSMIVNIVRLWGIRLPVIYLMGLSLGTTGIWYAMFISNMAVMIISGIIILRKKWLEKVI
jgi:Na+-driven multidrug efflux pump